MAQPAVKLLSVDHDGRTVTITISGIQYEYQIARGNFFWIVNELRRSLKSGWNNYSVTLLTRFASEIKAQGSVEMSRETSLPLPPDARYEPDDDHQFTLCAFCDRDIAAQLTWSKRRFWFSSHSAATDFAKKIFLLNKDLDLKIVVVQAMTQLAPKPQVELIRKHFRSV